MWMQAWLICVIPASGAPSGNSTAPMRAPSIAKPIAVMISVGTLLYDAIIRDIPRNDRCTDMDCSVNRTFNR